MFVYKSVFDFFYVEFPGLVGSLDTSGVFWPRVKDNTISNFTLAEVSNTLQKMGNTNSYTFLAASALLAGRVLRKVKNPG